MPAVDEIVLTLPRERAFSGVAHLVLGGLAARLNLTFEQLEDLQLALDSLVEEHDDRGDITVRLRISAGTIEAQVGPFGDSLRAEHTVVDRVELGKEQGDTWVTLTNRPGGGRALMAAEVSDKELLEEIREEVEIEEESFLRRGAANP
jgi:hypothetical protein